MRWARQHTHRVARGTVGRGGGSAEVEQPAGATRWRVRRERSSPYGSRTPHAGLLQFRLSSEHFVRDARFRLVYYFPADPATMHQCTTWAASPAVDTTR